MGDNRSIKATNIGTASTYFATFGKQNKVNIKKVYFAKEMIMNLISVRKLTDKNNTVISKGKVAKILDNNNGLMAIAVKVNGIYKLKSTLRISETSVNSAERNNNMSLKERSDRVLGHVNFGYLDTICKQQLLNGIPRELETEFMKCKICIENKMHNLPFENKRNKAKEKLEIVYTDVCGPFKTTGFNGEKYFVSFIDDYSKIFRVYCIKSKDEVLDCFISFVNESENLTGNCPAYVHELNGTAERFNRSIMDMARCLIAEAKVHKCYCIFKK